MGARCADTGGPARHAAFVWHERTRVLKPRDYDEHVLWLHPARRAISRRGRAGNDRGGVAWTRGLTVLDGGAMHRHQPARPTAPIRVLLAESAALVRAGLRSLLERERDMTVIGEATSGQNAVDLAAQQRPDVVLMDIDLPGLNGLEATRQMRANPNLSRVQVVLLSSEKRDEDLFGALRCGASGFVVLDTDPVELVQAVRVVAAGGAHLSPWATRRVMEELASMPDAHAATAAQFDELTARERDIVALVAQGLSNREIAEWFVISPATVKTHVSRAITKLQARDRAQLVALAHQAGFVRRYGVGGPDVPGAGSAASA